MAARRMKMQHIEAFRAVMLTGSMTQAARRLHTSQPQISRLIGQLESLTRFPLFDRGAGRLVPTLDGARFFQEVEKAFIGLSGLEASAAGIRSFGAGRLSMAAMPRLAGGLLTQAAAGFKAEHPDVMISIRSGTASTVHNWVSSGFCDVGLAMLYSEATGVQVEPVLTTDCVAIMPAGHKLAQKKLLTPRDFAGEPFISFPKGSPLCERIDAVFNAAGIERVVVAETDLGASICALVAAGLGISLINPLAAYEERHYQDRRGAGLVVRPFEPAVPITIALLYPPYATRSRLIDVFGGHVHDIITAEFSRVGGWLKPPRGKRAKPS